MWWSLQNDRYLWSLILYLTLQGVFYGIVSAAYYPNFGLVGCYRYNGYMDVIFSSKFTKIPFNNIVSEKPPEARFLYCVHGCLSNSSSFLYAGLMNPKGDYECFCGKKINQTFAVDLNECSQDNYNNDEFVCMECMKIYNTDYDMKPLLSIPGYGSNFFDIWNSSKSSFMGDVMRNPAIDLWNEKKLYHTPEYVKLRALNRDGENLWEMDFFTNTSSADLLKWFKKEKVLQQTAFSIKCNKREIAITDENEESRYYLTHGAIQSGPRVTLVTKDNAPKQRQSYRLDCTFPEDERKGPDCKGIGNFKTPENCDDPCTSELVLEIISDETYYICGVETSTCEEHSIYITIKRNNVNSIHFNLTEFRGPQFLDSCVLATAIMIKSSMERKTKKCRFSIYYQKDDDAWAIVDRMVVLGFYHNEEPKVSKWEFLNDFPLKEVYNILRPQLDKNRDEGSVPIRNLSSQVRKKESATDVRTSSKGIGIMGGCLLGIVVLMVAISDVLIIKTQLTELFRNLYSFFRTTERRNK